MITKTFKLTVATDTEEQMQKEEEYLSMIYGAEEIGTPLPKGRWIHVSERLPEDIKPVIVTWKNTDPKSYYQYIVGKHFIGTAHYKSGKWFWYSSVTEDLLAEYGRCDSEEFDEAIEVVAWMPLPEPYKEAEMTKEEIDCMKYKVCCPMCDNEKCVKGNGQMRG